MDDLLREFLTETAESLSVLDVELVRFEQKPEDQTILGNIFRLVHTIKGTCGFLGLPRLATLAHAGENVLGKFRDRELTPTTHSVTLILRALDTIKAILATLEETGAEPAGSDEALIAELNHAAAGGTAPAAVAEPAAPAPAGTPEPDEFGFVPVPVASATFDAPPAEPARKTNGKKAKKADAEAGTDTDLVPVTAAPAANDRAVALRASAVPAAEDTEAAAPAPAATVEHRESNLASQNIRVSVDLLESLMTTVSELVLTRNQLLQILRSNQRDSEFAGPLQRLNQVTSELQEGVMKTRMQPIGNAWSKLPRLVRDTANDLKKKVDLQMIGAETELDRQVLELIRDPLTHMVRNSIDHGLEMPADRVAIGKPEIGHIKLNAFHEGGHILIEIADDGKGLPMEAIRRKVVQNGLATEAELAGLTDQQIQQFIFKPGFSTAAKVTSVSGRGVGMDVVKTNIEKIGGTVDLKSIEGRGTTFTIKIPLTLAIVSALIIESGGERFALPQISVSELVRATPNGEHRIQMIKATPVLRLRDRLLPLVSLAGLLQLPERNHDDGETFIVVTQVGTNIFGIIVDQVFDTEEIVVKPVAPILRDIPLFSGNTILGDGSVIMILDPNGIAAAAGEMQGADHAGESNRGGRGVATTDADSLSLLLFRAGAGAVKAVALSLVARLEDIEYDRLELSNGSPVVQYRGQLMPLVPCDPDWVPVAGKRCSVLVFTDGRRSMGLVVDQIVDIVEDRLRIELGTERSGFLGSAIIAGRATDVIDTGFYLRQAYHDWFGSEEDRGFELSTEARILLVDDSAFFRNLVTPFLAAAGYSLTAVDGANQALALAEAGERFDLIISDIEMPEMNGFEFANAVRKTSIWAKVPMVALSSHASQRDRDRGVAAGFTDHVAKLDRDGLLATLQRILQTSHREAA